MQCVNSFKMTHSKFRFANHPEDFATSQTAPIRVDGNPFNDFIISTPEGLWGKPKDLAGTAVFLASRASSFVNGQIIYVDGGILATIGKPMNE